MCMRDARAVRARTFESESEWVSLIPLIKSPFERGQSGRRFILVVLVDLLPDLRAVFASIISQECLSSLSSHVSGWMGCVCP